MVKPVVFLLDLIFCIVKIFTMSKWSIERRRRFWRVDWTSVDWDRKRDCEISKETGERNNEVSRMRREFGKPLGPIFRIQKFWSKVDVRGDDECWNWKGKKLPKGYGIFVCFGEQIYAHRFSLELSTQKPLGNLFALHKCDNPSCVNPNHLFSGTQMDNLADCKQKKRHQYGECHHNAKLTEAQVIEIKKLLKSGEKPQSVADKFGVSRPTVHFIGDGKRWGHVNIG